MAPAVAQEKLYTIDDIYALPEGERAELIDGQIYYMAPPNTRHQRILSFLHLEIGNHIRASQRPRCKQWSIKQDTLQSSGVSDLRGSRQMDMQAYPLGSLLRENEGACEVFPAPFAVFLFADDSKYVEPDISVICDKNKLDDRGCSGAPDWIIEIVSPGSRSMDYYTKLSLYRSAGVREYWVVDPMKQAVLVYNMEHAAAPAVYSFADSIKAHIYDNLEIDFLCFKKLVKIA